jgi:hypothetical protein
VLFGGGLSAYDPRIHFLKDDRLHRYSACPSSVILGTASRVNPT